MKTIQDIINARKEMLAARKAADLSAKQYRQIVRQATKFLIQTEQISQREIARRIGISEGALRALLRPKGTTRKDYQK